MNEEIEDTIRLAILCFLFVALIYVTYPFVFSVKTAIDHSIENAYEKFIGKY